METLVTTAPTCCTSTTSAVQVATLALCPKGSWEAPEQFEAEARVISTNEPFARG